MIEHGEAGDCYDVDSFQLISNLIEDIQLLSSEVVRLRYLLSWHLSKEDGETIRGEIVGDLHGGYSDYSAYRHFVSEYCDGYDPLESERFCGHLAKLSKGERSDEFRSLTF